MGNLTITLLKSDAMLDIHVEKARVRPEPSTMYALVRLQAIRHWFKISGVTGESIPFITVLVPQLQIVLKSVNSPSSYGIPQHFTFAKENQLTSIAIAGSARALYTLLVSANLTASRSQGSPIETLVLHHRDKPYKYFDEATHYVRAYFSTKQLRGALEWLPDQFNLMKPGCFPVLAHLQLLVAPNAANVLQGIALLLQRDCLPNLQKLELEYIYASDHQPHTDMNGSFLTEETKKDIGALESLYIVLDNPKFNRITHLRLPLWTQQSTLIGLLTLQRLYPTLKTLTIDMVMEKLEIKQVSSSDLSKFVYPLVESSGPSHAAAAAAFSGSVSTAAMASPAISILDGIIKNQAQKSQLECLEIYRWDNNPSAPSQFADEIVAAYIEEGYLPCLTTIALQMGTGSKLPDKHVVPISTMLDASYLLEAVIASQLNKKITTLKLLLPEKNSYYAWLRRIEIGDFPGLEILHYRVPDPYPQEAEVTYCERVMDMLDYIYKALEDNKIPQIKEVNFEGNIQEDFAPLLQRITEALPVRIRRSASLTPGE